MTGYIFLTLMLKTMNYKNSLFIDSYQDFLSSYRSYKTLATASSLKNCLELMQPCFQVWEKDFFSPGHNDNINILTLFSLLVKDDKPKASLSFKTKAYKDHLLLNQLKFTDHLNESFLMHMQKETILYDNYSKDYRFLFYIAQEIKYGLFKIIRKILQYVKRDFHSNPSAVSFAPTQTFDNHINLELHFLFHSNKLLYSILISLMYENSTWKNVKKKFNLTNQDYILLKKEVNSWTNIVLSSS